MDDPNRARWCVDCGREFVWTAAEQALWARLAARRTDRRWLPPSRCRYCRRLQRDWIRAEGRHVDDLEKGGS